MTIISGHQPSYLPWLGLIHKISLCDIFVFMDDVQFLDRDFNHRNRVLTSDGKILWLTVPVARKASPSLCLRDILIMRDGQGCTWQENHLKIIQMCYGKCAFFKRYFPFFQWLYLENSWEKLAELDLVVLRQVFEWFSLTPKLVLGSEQNFTQKKDGLLLEHCLRFDADVLVTGEQGANYIQREDFERQGVAVYHQKYKHPEYSQGKFHGVSHLAFIDLLFRFGDEAREIALSDNVTRESICAA